MTEKGSEEKFKPRIVRVYETITFDPERGTYRAVNVRFEYEPGRFEDILIPKDEYTPEVAKAKVREWLERYGAIIGEI